MDEERAEVFEDVDEAPGDLGTEVFDVDAGAIAEAGGGEGLVGGVGDEGAIAAFCDAEAVGGGFGGGGEVGV